jgi:hypothetical protein
MEVGGQLHAPAAFTPRERASGVPQSQSGHSAEEKNSQPLRGIEPWNPNCPSCSLVTIPTELSWLLGNGTCVVLTASKILKRKENAESTGV